MQEGCCQSVRDALRDQLTQAVVGTVISVYTVSVISDATGSLMRMAASSQPSHRVSLRCGDFVVSDRGSTRSGRRESTLSYRCEKACSWSRPPMGIRQGRGGRMVGVGCSDRRNDVSGGFPAYAPGIVSSNRASR